MAGLSTHVLDTARGGPAVGVPIELFEIIDGEHRPVSNTVTNNDGRTDAPLLGAEQMRAGVFEILFHVGAYFAGQSAVASHQGFLDQVPIRFTIADPSQHYHVPLLASPWSYTTYRGS
jgi:hydroxyisourate hydrolase